MEGPFRDPRPVREWPEGERLRYIEWQARSSPGAGGSVALLLLLEEVERLSKRVRELEEAKR